MSIDGTLHSLFGASKVAADILVQEYGRYFGMKTACFRGGCLTGPNHSGTQLHGFLAYLMKCAVTGTPYTIFGYNRKQVRDNIHAADLVRAFEEVFRNPCSGEVYNIGGGRHSNCSMLEAIALCEEITGNEFACNYVDGESPRRPHLVDQRSEPLSGSLSGVEDHLRCAANPERDLRAECRTLERNMRQLGKKNVIGILIDALDYEASVDFILRAARERRGAAISALAVHGVMTGVLDSAHKFRLNHFDLLVPDGQPVRWVLNWLHGAKLADRVYGPTLTLKVCEQAAAEGQSIYLYGSTTEILSALQKSSGRTLPRHPHRRQRAFEVSPPYLQGEIRSRSAHRGFRGFDHLVGLGCPRQESFAYEFRDALSMPVVAVGAAFPFIAGRVAQAPRWMQDRGLEWLFRLCDRTQAAMAPLPLSESRIPVPGCAAGLRSFTIPQQTANFPSRRFSPDEATHACGQNRKWARRIC